MANNARGGFKAAKNFDPTRSKRKPGSKSPKHRGHRPEDAAPKKSRWTADDRAARTDRPKSARPERSDRPHTNRTERPDRAKSDRYDRTDRPRSSRPARAERPEAIDRRAPQRRDTERAYRDTERAQRPTGSPDRRSSRYFDDRGIERTQRKPRRDAAPARSHATDDVVLERLQAQAIEAADVRDTSFTDLGLGKNIAAALHQLGAERPFPIQAATIPDVLAGEDVLGRGRTGSGKTIAFGAPLVERLLQLNLSAPRDRASDDRSDRGSQKGKRRQHGRAPRALILAPTRELALQIDRTVQPIAQSVGLFTTQIYGGVPQGRQVGALQRGVDIVIGTPGRIEDLIEQRKLELSQVTITVLDEADHMCDLGFLEPVQRILRQTAPGGQKLLFSATLDKGVAALISEFLPSPRVHEVAGEDQASSTIDHRVLLVNREDKLDIIQQLVDRPGKILVFSRTRAYAERLADELDDAGIPTVSLHGDLNQAKRTRNLEKLTNGRVNVLVATDVAARGIHVDDIDLVIQADPPDEYKTYLHRAGRTGRAGRAGTVVTLVPRNRQKKTRELLQRAEIEAELRAFAPGDSL